MTVYSAHGHRWETGPAATGKELCELCKVAYNAYSLMLQQGYEWICPGPKREAPPSELGPVRIEGDITICGPIVPD